MDAITLPWVGGEHEFALPLGQLRKLQDTCNAGPEEILHRLRNGNWRVDDLIEPIRLGLIGGGMAPSEAGRLVTKLIEQGGWIQFKLTALAILAHGLFGPEDDTPEKRAGEAQPPANGSSAASMAPGAS